MNQTDSKENLKKMKEGINGLNNFADMLSFMLGNINTTKLTDDQKIAVEKAKKEAKKGMKDLRFELDKISKIKV